ncbi:MAG: tripartite tricarboxylate transporter TctB family protein, partial [Deltaproteobacteria bacterium]|nr:tripartite tricarboxylate transporter TctB family protein [Deltaproteobacteria bacterium]
MEGKNQRKEKITAVVLFGFSLLYFFSCWHLKLGTASNPGPGFIPVVIGSLLLLCTTSYLMRVFGSKFSERKTGDIAAGEEKNYRAIYGILACTTAYPFILEILKFSISTLTVAFVMLILLKPQRPIFSIFLA